MAANSVLRQIQWLKVMRWAIVLCLPPALFLTIIFSLSGGLGDIRPVELRILGAAALQGEIGKPVDAAEIPSPEYAVLDTMPIPKGVKKAQATSVFGSSGYQTLALQGRGFLAVPLHTFWHGDYTCMRVNIENTSQQTVQLLTEACQLRVNGVESPSTGIRAVVIGFDCGTTNYLILDNGEGPWGHSGGLFASGDGVTANAYLGCKPYNSFKKIIARKGYADLEIPSGSHAIVTLCYLHRFWRTASFDIILRSDVEERISGFRIAVVE